jgi:hypothetical protein
MGGQNQGRTESWKDRIMGRTESWKDRIMGGQNHGRTESWGARSWGSLGVRKPIPLLSPAPPKGVVHKTCCRTTLEDSEPFGSRCLRGSCHEPVTLSSAVDVGLAHRVWSRDFVQLREASDGLYSGSWKNPFARRKSHLFSRRKPARIGGAVAGDPASSLFATVRTRARVCRP